MPDPASPTPTRASAAGAAYTLTKDLIISGGLPGGSLISEGDIAARAGLSRTPVREAFLRLEAEGLMTLHPKRGAVIVPVSPGEAEDVLQLRRALETAAAERIATRGLPAGVRGRLDALIERQRELAEQGDVAGFAEADEAFHRGIVEASGNELAERFYGTLADRQRRMSVTALRPRPERLSVLVEEHTALRAHLAAGEVETFEAALRAHFVATHGRDGTD